MKNKKKKDISGLKQILQFSIFELVYNHSQIIWD